MSDSESAAAAPHPTTGGKSMETVQAQQNRIQAERQPYERAKLVLYRSAVSSGCGRASSSSTWVVS